MFWLFFGGISLFVLYVMLSSSGEENQRELARSRIASFFRKRAGEPTKEYIFPDGDAGIALNEEHQLLMFTGRDGGAVYLNTIPYAKLIRAEVIEDGSVVSSTDTGGKLVGAAAGGILFGGAGAVVGAISGGDTTTTNHVNRICLRLFVDDVNHPYHEFDFVKPRAHLYRGGDEHRRVLATAYEWQAQVERILKHQHQ